MSLALSLALALPLLLPVVLLMAVAGFNMPSMLDDYHFALRIREEGFWGSQLWWYTHWLGRYTSTALLSLHGLFIHSRLSVLVPVAILTGLPLTLWVLLKQCAGEGVPSKLMAWVAMILGAWHFSNMPSGLEGLYWLPGAITYELPVVCSLALFALVIRTGRKTRGRSHPWWVIGGGLMGLFAAGFSEVTLFLLLLVMVGGVVLSWRSRVPAAMLAWGVALAAVVIGALLLGLAPANAMRASCFGAKPGLLDAIALAVKSTIWLAWNWANGALGLAVLLVVLLPLWMFAGKDEPERDPELAGMRTPGAYFLCAVICGLAGMVLMVASVFPWWAIQSVMNPPGRIQNVCHFMFGGGVVASALFMGLGLRRFVGTRYSVGILRPLLCILILGLGGMLMTGRNARAAMAALKGPAMEYQAEMRARAGMMKSAGRVGGVDLCLPPIRVKPRLLFMSDLSADSSHGGNRVYARVWGVESVRICDDPGQGGWWRGFE